jgi:Na+-transporting NADH:ubiquinone oxidoreductase subunit NqrB
MAKKIKKPITQNVKKTNTPKVIWDYPLTKQNYKLIAIGLGVILLGYLFMLTGLGEEFATPDGAWQNPMAISLAPTLLVIGYCVIIPYSIIKFFSHSGKSE